MPNNMKQDLMQLKEELQEKEQKAQRMEGVLENNFQKLEEELGTRDLKEAEKIIAERNEKVKNRKDKLAEELTLLEWTGTRMGIKELAHLLQLAGRRHQRDQITLSKFRLRLWVEQL